MDCQCCNKKQSGVHIFDVASNAVEQQFGVCTDCFALIKRYLFEMSRPLIPTADVIREVQALISTDQTALAKLPEPGGITPVNRDVPTCPECGMTLSEFRAKGRFGCPRDYELFHEHLEPLLERIHDVQPARHEGRLPASTVPVVSLDRAQQMARLRKQLDAAIAEENYEQAADLRDQIKQLEQQPAGGAP